LLRRDAGHPEALLQMAITQLLEALKNQVSIKVGHWQGWIAKPTARTLELVPGDPGSGDYFDIHSNSKRP